MAIDIDKGFKKDPLKRLYSYCFPFTVAKRTVLLPNGQKIKRKRTGRPRGSGKEPRGNVGDKVFPKFEWEV